MYYKKTLILGPINLGLHDYRFLVVATLTILATISDLNLGWKFKQDCYCVPFGIFSTKQMEFLKVADEVDSSVLVIFCEVHIRWCNCSHISEATINKLLSRQLAGDSL